VLQTTVFVTFSLAVILEFAFGISFEPQTTFVVLYLAALLFLLCASPFFFESLGKQAVIGWIVAFAILVISMCFPAKA